MKKHTAINKAVDNLYKYPATKKRILVVDDDPSIRDILKIILEREGYETEMMRDPSNILNGNYRVPDLYLIDKLLSGTDGVEICQFLKESPTTRDIPVLLISALPDIGRISAHAGADGFIEKPFDMKKFLATLETHLKPARLEKTVRSS
jgi:DNA-binding response OmpR family regulator